MFFFFNLLDEAYGSMRMVLDDDDGPISIGIFDWDALDLIQSMEWFFSLDGGGSWWKNLIISIMFWSFPIRLW